MTLGVILVTYKTGDIVLDSLDALLAARDHPGCPEMRVIVVDNASPDGTLDRLRGWAARRSQGGAGPVRIDAFDLAGDGHPTAVAPLSEGAVSFLQAGTNDGFAAGINHGLRTFLPMEEEVDWFWLLNSDAMVEPQTPAAMVRAARAAEAEHGAVGAVGGRIFLTDPPLTIQSDGGRIDFRTGRLLPANLGRAGRDVAGPAPGELEFITGGHMMVSRAFVAKAGLMPEHYFLYYEEVEWVLGRGDLPLVWAEDAVVHHENGSSIGSQRLNAAPSPLAAYWMFRNRLKFVSRHNRSALPVSWAYSLGKVAQFVLRGHFAAAGGALRGMAGFVTKGPGLGR